MLLDYVNKAMEKAVYEKLGDGTYSGEIPICPGTVAFGANPTECQENLLSALEDWLLNGIRHGDELPVIDGTKLGSE